LGKKLEHMGFECLLICFKAHFTNDKQYIIPAADPGKEFFYDCSELPFDTISFDRLRRDFFGDHKPEPWAGKRREENLSQKKGGGIRKGLLCVCPDR